MTHLGGNFLDLSKKKDIRKFHEILDLFFTFPENFQVCFLFSSKLSILYFFFLWPNATAHDTKLKTIT